MKPKQLDFDMDAIEEKMALLRKLQREARRNAKVDLPAAEVNEWLEDQIALWAANNALDIARTAAGLTPREREEIRASRVRVKQRLGIAA